MAARPTPLDATVITPPASGSNQTAVLPPVPDFGGAFMPPPPGVPVTYAGPPQPLHPLVLLPVLGLLGIIGVLQYLAHRDWELLGHLFSGGILEFSHRAVSLAELALTLSITVTILAMIVGLFRGSRIAHGLTITFAAGVAVGELTYLAAKGQPHMWVQPTWVAPVLLPVSVVIIVALLPYPGLRAFFAQRNEGPLGIGMARVAAAYFGWNLTVFAVLLTLGAGLVGKILYWGVGFLAIAALLLIGYQLLVRLGAIGGAIIGAMCLAYIGTVIAFVIVNHGIFDLSVIVGMVVAAAAFAALWMPESSRRYYGPAGTRGTTRPVAATVTAFVLFVAVAVGGIVVGSIAKSKGEHANNYYDSSSYDSSSDDSSDYSTDTPSYSYDTPSDTPTEEDSPSYSSYGAAASFTNEWTMTATATGGYTESITLEAGDPMRYTSGMRNGSATAGAECSIDPQTDAVIPARITVTNTSPGDFDVVASWDFGFVYGWSNPEVDIHFSSGDQCESSSVNGTSTSALGKDESTVGYLFFVLHNYYSPDYPNGDPSVAQSAAIQFSSSSGTDDSGDDGPTFTPGAVSGPGVTDSYGTSTIPLVP